MSSHYDDARKIEILMLKYNMDKNHKNLVMIASQDLDLSIAYVKKLIDSEVDSLEKVKLNPYHSRNHQKFINERNNNKPKGK